MTKKCLFALHLAFLCLTAPAMAAPQAGEEAEGRTAVEEEKSKTVHQLENVVVTASGYEQDIKNAPASITVITREELEKRQFSSLADAVRGVEGITQIGGYTGGFSIRGMDGDSVLILIDGKRQDTKDMWIKHSGGGRNSNANNFIPPVEAIERIEIIRGPMSTLYGSEAMGGVINIITRKVAHKWSGALSWDHTWHDDDEYGANNQYDLYLSGPVFSDKVGLQVWGYDKRNGSNKSDATTTTNRIHRQNGTARLWITPVKEHEFMLEAGQENQLYYTDPTSTSAYVTKNPEYKKDSYSIAHNGDWGFGKSDINLYYNNTYRQGVNEQSNPRVSNYVAEGKFSLPLANHMIVAGGQWKELEVKNDGYFYVSASSGQRSPIKYSTINKAFFVEDEIAVFDWFSLLGGVRYDNNDQYGSEWTPRAYALWHPTAELTIKGGAAFGYRAPTPEESDANIAEPKSTGTIWGNPDLDPEKSINYEIGVHYTASRLSASLTGFYTSYKNKIAQVNPRNFFILIPGIETMHGLHPTLGYVTSYTNAGVYGGGGWGTYVNYGKAEARGIEASIGYKFTDTIKARLNYTYTDSEIKSGSTTVYGTTIALRKGDPMSSTPEHMANFVVDWQAFESLGFFAMAQYRGKETEAAWTGAGALDKNKDDLLTYDVGFNWNINEYLTLSGTVYNITDDKRSDDEDNSYAYDEYGRRFWVKVAASF